MTEEGKPGSASRLVLAQVMTPQDANIAGTGHGGNIMKLADTASAVIAIRQADPGPPAPSGDGRRPSTEQGGRVARRDQEKTNIAGTI